MCNCRQLVTDVFNNLLQPDEIQSHFDYCRVIWRLWLFSRETVSALVSRKSFLMSLSNQDPVTISGGCANGHKIRSNYEIAYISSSGTFINTCLVNGTDCCNGVCRHQLQNNIADYRCQPPVPQFNGENVTIVLTTIGRSINAVLSKTSELLTAFL